MTVQARCTVAESPGAWALQKDEQRAATRNGMVHVEASDGLRCGERTQLVNAATFCTSSVTSLPRCLPRQPRRARNQRESVAPHPQFAGTAPEMEPMSPTSSNGKICYTRSLRRRARSPITKGLWLEHPSTRRRHTAFDDTTGQVSGSWIVGRFAIGSARPSTYIMVDDAASILDAIAARRHECAADRCRCRRSRRDSATRAAT